MNTCDVMHESGPCMPTDMHGCILPNGHGGPHEFVDPHGKHWLWETDLECTCWWCRRCEGDYCTVYWEKP